MQKWLGGYDGRSAQRAAREIHDLIVSKNTTPRIPFTFAMVRKKWKLFVLHAFNEPYTFQPKHFIRRKFKGKQEQVSIKYRNYLKSVRPSDVTFARDQLKRLDSSTQPGPPPAR
jgi:hypothetical protein